MKRWIYHPYEQCDEHGQDVEILTDAEQPKDGGVCANDGDECRCSEGCKGWMTADEDSFYCNWDDSNDEARKAAKGGEG